MIDTGTWEYFTNPNNNINNMFSYYGISDYTHDKNLDNFFDDIKSFDKNSKCNNFKNPLNYGWSKDNQNYDELEKSIRYRLILDTPFSTHTIISCGLIVFAKDTKRWAITQRKHSAEFLLIFRGIYRPTFLPFLLSHITSDECDIIKVCLQGGPNTFKDIYLIDLGFRSDGLLYATVRMAESYTMLMNILPNLNLSTNALSWTWPKGRPHISSVRETLFECAKREFIEEVEINLPNPVFISNTYISENVKTITGRHLESRYWIYIIPNEIPMTKPKSHPEVADRLWVDTKTCYTMIDQSHNYLELFEQIANME